MASTTTKPHSTSPTNRKSIQSTSAVMTEHLSKSQSNLSQDSSSSSAAVSGKPMNKAVVTSNGSTVVFRKNLARQLTAGSGFKHAPSDGAILMHSHQSVDTGLTVDPVVDSLLLVGTVKRQVESINFNSKPCIVRESDTPPPQQQPVEDNLSSDVAARFYLNDASPNGAGSTTASTNNLDENQTVPGDLQQTTTVMTTSPDSKRFKCELSPTSSSDTNTIVAADSNTTNDDNAAEIVSSSSPLSRLSEFNRSKKVRFFNLFYWLILIFIISI